MKKYLLIVALILTSCSKEDYSKFNYTFYNSTEFDLIIVANEEISSGNTDFSYSIKSKETITFSLSGFYGLFNFIPSTPTERVFDYKFNSYEDLDYTIISYEYEIKYMVSGTTNKASITYNTSSGGTGQSTRTLPYSIRYKNFNDDWVYLSAQSEDGMGTVKVEIFVEDKLKYSDQASGFGIATASGDWINLNY